ncbi:MAG: hypothetical protein ACREQ4_13900 [Candidatus Binataceae bacterium]
MIDGRAIEDSTIICEYLEEVYPKPPVYPHDAYERGRAIHPSWFYRTGRA